MEGCLHRTLKLRVKAERFQGTSNFWKSEALVKFRRPTALGIIQYALLIATRRSLIQFSSKICDFEIHGCSGIHSSLEERNSRVVIPDRYFTFYAQSLALIPRPLKTSMPSSQFCPGPLSDCLSQFPW